MKFVIGSSPVNFLPTQLSRPFGQPKAAERSTGVSVTWSPVVEQPPWKAW